MLAEGNAESEALLMSESPKRHSMADRSTDSVDDQEAALELDPELDASCSSLGCNDAPPIAVLLQVICLPSYILQCCGCFVLSEKREIAVLYFGKYVGSVSSPGIHCLPPLGVDRREISTATRTMDMKDLKVVDRAGNPVIVSAVVTFVATSARKARIEVENPWPNASWQRQVGSGTYLQLQAQAVLKQVTSQFPYEAPNGEPSLQTEGSHITEMLMRKLQQRVLITGAKILSFDLVDLSYAPEIAQSMLLRQQAAALVDARALIVKAAVEMTHSAVESLQMKKASLGQEPFSKETVERISSNLLTVVCSNEAVTPMVSMGGVEDSSSNTAVLEALASLSQRIPTYEAQV
ncbi:MAG: hypothetical protein SGBAC_000519 [Bacillariaceae sp.]